MTVSVASRLYRPAGLSVTGRTVLGFIDGGAEWLEWAMGDQQARYHFKDESALLAGIQIGVHGTPFLLMQRLGLMVSPVKLMTMSSADLGVLGNAEAGSGPVSPAVSSVMTAHALATQTDLVRAAALPGQLGVADAPVFQASGLEAQLALLGLARETGTASGGLLAEAADFAAARAQNVFEYADYQRACLACWSVLSPAFATPEGRAAAIADTIATLLPLTFAALDCPSVEGLVAPWEVNAAISEWLMMGRQIGFARSSLAIQQIIANAGWSGQTGREATTLVRAYLARAQLLLNAGEVGQGMLGQDGATCLFRIEANGDCADVELGPTGLITLRRFGPLPPPLPEPTPPPPPSQETMP